MTAVQKTLGLRAFSLVLNVYQIYRMNKRENEKKKREENKEKKKKKD